MRTNALAATFMLLFAVILLVAPSLADEPGLTVTFGTVTRHYTLSELLARPDVADVTTDHDPFYQRSTTFRAVPLAPLLAGVPSDQFDTVEMHATDGFIAQIPLALARPDAPGGAEPWIAVEPPGRPWPVPSDAHVGAGPFYLIWQHAERSGITREQWVNWLDGLTAVASPAHRWPQLAVAASLPADAAARRGQAVFTSFCLPCHRIKGGGDAKVGPDLGKAGAYLTEPGIRALVRDPKAVRTWPQQHMPGFDAHTLPDADLDALVAYLRVMAETGQPLR